MGVVNFNEEFKDKLLKRLAILVALVFLGVVITFTVITIIKIRDGQHVKVFGLEYNIPQLHPDTVVKIVTIKPEISIPKLEKPISHLEAPQLTHKKIIEKPVQKDTPIKSEQLPNTQQPLQSNSGNSHVVNGINNGVNGDVNVNQEKTISPELLSKLLDYIEEYKKIQHFNSNCFIIGLTGNSNGNKIADQIETFMKSKGYTTKGGRAFVSLSEAQSSPIMVDKLQDCIEITLGRFN